MSVGSVLLLVLSPQILDDKTEARWGSILQGPLVVVTEPGFRFSGSWSRAHSLSHPLSQAGHGVQCAHSQSSRGARAGSSIPNHSDTRALFSE